MTSFDDAIFSLKISIQNGAMHSRLNSRRPSSLSNRARTAVCCSAYAQPEATVCTFVFVVRIFVGGMIQIGIDSVSARITAFKSVPSLIN